MINKEKFSLEQLGWNEYFENYLNELPSNEIKDLKIGRIAVEYKYLYKVFTERGEKVGKISGKMKYNKQIPVVGDFVLFKHLDDGQNVVIYDLLPRKSRLSRKAAGENFEEQVIISNVDTIFIVSSLNKDYNPRRLERYTTMVWDSGANPVIVLTKADLCKDPEVKKGEMETLTYGIPIHITSSIDKRGVEELNEYFVDGQTFAFIGSSGVGKSTLINVLLGEERQKVRDIRESDDKGKHATTNRELILLEKRGILADTPGLRDVLLWDTDEGLDRTFEDIDEISQNCRFKDCQHQSEPGCAVKEAIENGIISEKRLKSYFKLKREQEFLESKKSISKKLKEKEFTKKIHKINRNLPKRRLYNET